MGACQSSQNKFPSPPNLEEKDSWFEEIIHGVKHVGHEILDLVGSKIKHSVKDAERTVLKHTAKLNFPHLAETCIPGVYSHNGLHDDFEELFNSQIFNELGILKTTVGMEKFFDKYVGQERTPEAYEEIWKYTAEQLNFEADFLHFPKKLDAKQLKALVAANPFVTMGLSVDEGWVVFDATKNSKNPLTSMICGCLPDDYATAALYISEDWENVHVKEGGQVYQPDHPKFDVKLRIFITTLMYFFQIIHATLHVYAYIMLGAATQATTGTNVDSFMNQYEEKILTKYLEVTKLLITKPNAKSPGLVVGGFWPADYNKAMVATRKIFDHIASAKNAQEWLDKIFFAGNDDLKHNMHLLPQCRPYVGLTQSLAHKTVKQIPLNDREYVDVHLRKYLANTGGKNYGSLFALDSFQEWVECQTMMGILHGNTLSISRLIFTPYNRYDGDWESNTFSATAHTWSVVAGTLLGLEDDHAINETRPVKDTMFETMMGTMERTTADLQHKFWNTLEPEDRHFLGWIYSVWGPNMLGNTQLTCTTYV